MGRPSFSMAESWRYGDYSTRASRTYKRYDSVLLAPSRELRARHRLPGHADVAAAPVRRVGRWRFDAPALPAPRPLLLPGAGPQPISMQALVLCLVADDTCACGRVVRRRRLIGSPRGQDVSRRGDGLPGAWA